MKLKDNKNIFCTVSSGCTSVMMAIKMKEWYPNHNIIYAMANTSKERIESLIFMNKCDKYFGLNLNWIEADINLEKGKGTGFNVVTFDKLKKKGEIFEQGIQKYGIPNKINKWCNRELKIVPLKKFANSKFGINNYSIAVGLRIDEIDRISSDYKSNNTFYPPIENKISKRERNLFWKNSPIQITIPAFKGNCDDCFERSKRKKFTIYNEDPIVPIWWNEMEKKYSLITIDGKDSYNFYVENGGMFFNRGNESIESLIEQSKKPFRKATDEYIYENDLFDTEDECGSGCKIF